jgi:hypothetical protein
LFLRVEKKLNELAAQSGRATDEVLQDPRVLAAILRVRE